MPGTAKQDQSSRGTPQNVIHLMDWTRWSALVKRTRPVLPDQLWVLAQHSIDNKHFVMKTAGHCPADYFFYISYNIFRLFNCPL